MIKVEIEYKGKSIASLKVKGHADSAPYGKDLVCAAATAMIIGTANALAENFDIELEEGYASFVPKGPVSEHDNVVLETLILQLKTLEVSPATKGTLKIIERK